jgi:3'-phosphoadenosine 5'-phosphosulfate sulfotransferase (PAPS reductase)/FAD synthetase
MMDLFDSLDPLAMEASDVARLTRPEREARVRALIQQSHDFLSAAIEEHVWADGRMVAATVVLFSGGNDSTTLAHIFRDRVDCAAHANTTVGIEKTRQFVRDTCKAWDIRLIEKKPPREQDRYRAIVLDQGFPGPAHHWKMFTRLKERALEAVRNELVTNPRKERVVFIAGRRRSESQRRARVPISERKGSIVWSSPLVNWTKLDLTTYRLMAGDVPRNEVADLIHMSGECLCGAFAHENERAEIESWFPDAFAEVRELEALLAGRDDIPDYRKTWGWGWEKDYIMRRLSNAANGLPLDSGVENTTLPFPTLFDIDAFLADVEPSESGPLCSSCDDRFGGAA